MAKGKYRENKHENQRQIISEIERRNKRFSQSQTPNLDEIIKLLDMANRPIQYGKLSCHLDSLPSTHNQKGINELRENIQQFTKMRDTLLSAQEVRLGFIINDYNDKLTSIDDIDSFMEKVQQLVQAIENKKNEFIAQEPNDRTNQAFKNFMGDIASIIEDTKSKFSPQIWHKVADVSIPPLNGLKSIARSLGIVTSRVRMFDDVHKNMELYDKVIRILKDDSEFEPCKQRPSLNGS